jgi:hypothetical protein
VSSNSYSTCLTPDPWLRIAVLTSGRLLILIGATLILTLELGVLIRAAACLAWIVMGRFELMRLERGFEVCTAVRLSSDGQISVLDNEQQCRSCSLQSGSVVLKNYAWLRLRTVDGEYCVELLRGDARQGQQWRRLQVIWRHFGALP